jgi:hypothetical protein
MLVIGVPSLPGVVLDTDAVFGSLAAPELIRWAATAGTAAHPSDPSSASAADRLPGDPDGYPITVRDQV